MQGAGKSVGQALHDFSHSETGNILWNSEKAIANFLVLDDLHNLTAPGIPIAMRAMSAVSLLPGGKIIKGVKPLAKVVGRGKEALKTLQKAGLNVKAIQRYKKFHPGVIKNRLNVPVVVSKGPKGGNIFTTKLPGGDGASFTIWEKYENINHKTKFMGHRSFNPKGKFTHWHEKYPFKDYEIEDIQEYEKRLEQMLKYHDI